jgi:hypothetical protein
MINAYSHRRMLSAYGERSMHVDSETHYRQEDQAAMRAAMRVKSHGSHEGQVFILQMGHVEEDEGRPL